MFFDGYRRKVVEGITLGDIGRGYFYTNSDAPNDCRKNISFATFWTTISPLVGFVRGLVGDKTPVPYREIIRGWPTERIGEYIELHPTTRALTPLAATAGSLLPFMLGYFLAGVNGPVRYFYEIFYGPLQVDFDKRTFWERKKQSL